MSKMSKAIAVLGVVAGLGVAAMPLASYAAEGDFAVSKNAQVQVEVGGAISIDVAADDTEGASSNFANGVLDLGEVKLNGQPAEGTLKVTVKSNDPSGYTLGIKSQTAETAMTSTNGASIKAGAPAQGTSAWGFKGGDITSYTAITATDQMLKSTGATTGGDGTAADPAKEDTIVTFGVSADGKQAEGIYTNTVVFTATVK